PSAAGAAVRDDAQPRHRYPRQLPLLLHHRPHRGGFRGDHPGLEGFGAGAAGGRAAAAAHGHAAYGDGRGRAGAARCAPGARSGRASGVVRARSPDAWPVPQGRHVNNGGEAYMENAVVVGYDPFAGGAVARVVPTTEPQRELWLAAHLGEDGSLAYNESVSLHLRGELDTARLQQALQQVVGAHDALRASFGPDGETFCVLEPAPVLLSLTDLSALEPDARAAQLEERRRAGVETPFVLEKGRLFRAELLQLGPREHVLLMHAHHIVCDGWSWWVIVRELGAAYGGPGAQGQAGQGFADYALAEALRPAGPQYRDDERYWLSRFAS